MKNSLYHNLMDYSRRAAEVVEGAEKSLAALAAQAAGERDYATAGMLLAMAQRVSSAARLAESAAKAPSVSASGDAGAAGAKSASAPSGAGKRAYPQFRREGDSLVKIGWSKSSKTTYEHRSPRGILDRLVQSIVAISRRGGRFSTEQMLPLRGEDGTELPSYQPYLCLAWLVASELIEKQGRQGYTLAVPDLPAAVERKWESLPSR